METILVWIESSYSAWRCCPTPKAPAVVLLRHLWQDPSLKPFIGVKSGSLVDCFFVGSWIKIPLPQTEGAWHRENAQWVRVVILKTWGPDFKVGCVTVSSRTETLYQRALGSPWNWTIRFTRPPPYQSKQSQAAKKTLRSNQLCGRGRGLD